MGEITADVTVDVIELPKYRRPGADGAIVDVQGWLRAPVDWDGKRLERLWNGKHGRSRLGVGLCVANNPRRHFLLSNVSEDLAWVREELESLIAELQTSYERLHEPAHADSA
jgi:hypothetical protein